ncbi:MAG: AAA family ATPase [Pirellulales bacterium]
MSEPIRITLPVQIEHAGGQLIRARLISPWRTQVVGRTWNEVRPNLINRATKELAAASARRWQTGGRITSLPTHGRSVIDLNPPKRMADWREPIVLGLDTFRWSLTDGMTYIRVPALSCDLFGKEEDVAQGIIDEQIRISLLRLGESLDLWEIRARFDQQRFTFELVELEVELNPNRDDSSDKRKEERRKTKTLRAVAGDLTKADLAPVFGRDTHVAAAAEYLVGSLPQSLLLVGPAGVGKSAIVHRMASDTQRFGLGERKIWSTTGSRLVSGMAGLGMWQERCIKMIREAHATKAILHVGSLIELMEAGKIEGQPGVASMIRQAVARGRLTVIGECTPQQLAIIERDEPLLLRSLVRYDVNEPEKNELTAILRQAADDMVRTSARRPADRSMVTDAAIDELHRLHKRYATYSAMPAQPLRLLRSILERAPARSTIEADSIARAFSAQTGLPRFLVDDSEVVDLEAIRGQLAAHVIGQSDPVDLVVNLIAALKTRMIRPGKPLASLLFIGPTGVGKTEMAKALAALLYSDPRRMIRIDMSEYSSPWSAIRLIGKPDEGDGTLTSPIREQPFSVVLLDEFEKADAAVFDMLLQLLGEGRLTDSLGRTADFRNAVIIMTSNLGVESFREGGFGFNERNNASWRGHFEREVQRFVRPELLGRIDRIVPFLPLPPAIVRQIAVRELEQLKERPGLKYADVQVEFNEEVVDHVSRVGYQPKYGARPLRRAIEQQITVPISNELSRLEAGAAYHMQIEMKDGQVVATSSKTGDGRNTSKRTIETAIDDWQRLIRLAWCTANSSPLKDIDNETHRLVRINDSLFERLKGSLSARRAERIKAEIQQNAVVIEKNRLSRDALIQACDRIRSAGMRVMLGWYRNEMLSDEELFELPTRLQSELKVAVAALVEGRPTKTEEVCVVIVGKPITRAAVLWQAYESIAQENGWSIDYYTLRNYDPALDSHSNDAKKRSTKRPNDNDTSGPKEPAFHLLGEVGDPPKSLRTVDAFHEKKADAWLENDNSIGGVVLQLSGYGISAWLGNENGVMHFVDSFGPGQKKRQRFRVSVEEGKLVKLNFPVHWQDAPNSAERNPRRSFVTADGIIIDNLSGSSIHCGQSILLDCLTDVIRRDREAQLWRAVGFEGIDPAATLTAGFVITN